MKSLKSGDISSKVTASRKGLSQLGALTGLVYSTETGRMCPGCRQAVTDCACAQNQPPLPTGPVRVFRETKGRGGKSVTVVRGLALNPADLAAMGKKLRTACGSGGTEKDGTIEVQGDHVDKVVSFLIKAGHAAKRAG